MDTGTYSLYQRLIGRSSTYSLYRDRKASKSGLPLHASVITNTSSHSLQSRRSTRVHAGPELGLQCPSLAATRVSTHLGICLVRHHSGMIAALRHSCRSADVKLRAAMNAPWRYATMSMATENFVRTGVKEVQWLQSYSRWCIISHGESQNACKVQFDLSPLRLPSHP